MRNVRGKAAEIHMGADVSGTGQHAAQQMQQGGFAASVAPDRPSFHWSSSGECCMGKNRVIASGIRKTEILNQNL